MMKFKTSWPRAVAVAALLITSGGPVQTARAQWTNGMSTNANYFPIGVWLQRPEDAAQWKSAGVNLYNGLWQGPTADQLDTLRAAGMQTIAAQNSVGLNYTNKLPDGSPVIVCWLMDDEPDNAQPNGSGGYGPPVPTATVQQTYQQIKNNDPTRPIFLNLGQGIAWDNATWYGQGGGIVPDRDYPQYILGSDIISFDIYPMTSTDSQVAGQAWRVALGVDRLRHYAPSNHMVWCFIETGDISGSGHEATIPQIKAEVWMALIHGASGINYFIHGKTSVSDFDDRALLRPENADRLAGVTRINNELHSLAAALKTPTLTNLVTMTNVAGTNEVDYMTKQSGGVTYLLAVGMTGANTTKSFHFQNMTSTQLEVIGENRTVTLTNGSFSDMFNGYEAHLYRTITTSTNRLSITVEPPNANLSWNSTTGAVYALEYKTNLIQNGWQTLGMVTGASDTMTFTETGGLDRQRYYRVVVP